VRPHRVAAASIAAVILRVLFLLSAFALSLFVAKMASAAETSPTPNVASTASVVGSSALTYTAQRGDSIPSVAHHYLSKTSFLTSAELGDAIRHANGDRKGISLKAGETITIPGALSAPIVEKSVPVAKDFEVRAIYLTGLMAGSDHGRKIMRRWKELGGNAVVFDIKDSDGSLSVPFDHPLAGAQKGHPIPELPKFTRYVHSLGLHAIARVAIFRDERLVKAHPELAVQSKANKAAWRENGKLVWTDPSQPKVQEYDIALAKMAAESGADEVQFDYVRFPAEGNQKDASFYFQKEHPTWQRSDVIADFLKKAHAELHPSGVLFSLDVFGIMAWQRNVDLAHTGQDIVKMAKYCDVISPMIYPSHFYGMDGIARPGDAPEHFIGESMQRFELITKDSGVVLRPWLQAFGWRTHTYSAQYILTQLKVAREKGGVGFLLWNAQNNYSKPYEAMSEVATNHKAYFRGDEVGGVVKAAVAATSLAPPAPAAEPGFKPVSAPQHRY